MSTETVSQCTCCFMAYLDLDWTMKSGESTLRRPLMNAENKVGPRTEPCGTPEEG